uniref:PARG catalytic Macro domain-containing protein n=1 Tax=Arcella intermedia TaxID=1963864 RepID=A0A6B2L5T1_9EUKA
MKRTLEDLPEEFFEETLDLMLDKVLAGKSLFAEGLIETRTNFPSFLELTKEKVFTLMSLSFFGLMKYNFTDLLGNSEYTKCMANYYIRTCKELKKDPEWFNKILRIERWVLGEDETVPFTKKEPNWSKSDNTVEKVSIDILNEKKGIEDFRNAVQVNFADPYPGGTLPSTYGDVVQEEILFLIYPELFITCLLVPRIAHREAIAVSGLTRTNKYTGYQHRFAFEGDFTEDSNPITVLHMDALPGGERDKQSLDRELAKAYLAFSAVKGQTVATGHWGCGAFGGHHQRKFIVQLIAAAEAEVNLIYTTFGVSRINGAQEFYDHLKENQHKVKRIYKALCNNLGWGSGGGSYFQTILNEIKLLESE